MKQIRVPNAAVAARIGLTISGVSRIRNSNRHPHPITMRKIYQEYGWSIHDQFELAHFGLRDDYARKFERVLSQDPAHLEAHRLRELEDVQTREAN